MPAMLCIVVFAMRRFFQFLASASRFVDESLKLLLNSPTRSKCSLSCELCRFTSPFSSSSMAPAVATLSSCQAATFTAKRSVVSSIACVAAMNCFKEVWVVSMSMAASLTPLMASPASEGLAALSNPITVFGVRASSGPRGWSKPQTPGFHETSQSPLGAGAASGSRISHPTGWPQSSTRKPSL